MLLDDRSRGGTSEEVTTSHRMAYSLHWNLADSSPTAFRIGPSGVRGTFRLADALQTTTQRFSCKGYACFLNQCLAPPQPPIRVDSSFQSRSPCYRQVSPTDIRNVQNKNPSEFSEGSTPTQEALFMPC